MLHVDDAPPSEMLEGAEDCRPSLAIRERHHNRDVWEACWSTAGLVQTLLSAGLSTLEGVFPREKKRQPLKSAGSGNGMRE